jgi:hypothetical protein
MARLVMAVLTGALCVSPYVEIKTALPSRTARLPTHPGLSTPVAPVPSTDMNICFLLQLIIYRYIGKFDAPAEKETHGI